MDVLKFGGSSVGSIQNIKQVKNIIESRERPFIVVVSAFKGVTDQLDHLAQKALLGDYNATLGKLKERHHDMVKGLINTASQSEVMIQIQQKILELENLCLGIHSLEELSEKTKSRIIGMGEIMSVLILHHYLNQEKIEIENLPTHDLILANHNFLNAEVNYSITYQNIDHYVSKNKNYIAPGFVAKNTNNERVVLGRGGSDYTASLIAGAIDADTLELWSDVNGMLNANPGMVKNASSINRLSYKEAFEMAYFGAKVVYPPAIRPVMQKEIPVYLKNTNFPEKEGTLIHGSNESETNKIIGVSTLPNMAVLTVSGVGLAGTKGVARRVFQAMEQADINIVFITQACSEQSICLGIKTDYRQQAQDALNNQFALEMKDGLVNPVEIDKNQTVLAVIGDNMKHQVGLSGKIFGALGENNVSVKAIAQGASERNISIVIDEKNEHKAVNVIHERFFQATIKKVHLFIAGIGNVGSQFLKILEKQQPVFMQEYQTELKIVGVANSRKYILNRDGIKPKQVQQINDSGTAHNSIEAFVKLAKNMNLRNSIFIDNTASEEVSLLYPGLFEKSISVVTCNKYAGSSPTANYQNLKNLTREKNCHFQYETSVAAALPVIKTIQDLLHSGDKITKIEAVLSGSLNFIFNNYDGSKPFAEIVQQAKDEGYTEPDPRIDLTGLDVMRKILILARESGYTLELDDVDFNGFLPEETLKAESTGDFIKALYKTESHFKNMFDDANKKGCRLKVVAGLEEGKLSVSLKQIAADSPFYQLDGKDNIVSINTIRYQPEPLIVKGAGAGAEVTASGVFSDLIYIVNR